MKVVFILLLCISQLWSLPNARPPSTRIIGGQEATAGEFPQAAAIYKTTSNGNYFCTGSILSVDWVITAGQCVDGAISFTILLGTHKLDGDLETVQRLATSEYILHPDYNPTTLENDLGLIKFRLPITFTGYIRPLNLPHEGLTMHDSGTTFGWGQTTDGDADLSNTLNYVGLTAVSDEQCRITYGSQLVANMICFEGNYNEGACFGDSGSPIIQAIKGVVIVVVAISSFFSANGCESTDPSGYTQVFPYNEWITNVTGVGLNNHTSIS